MSGREDRQRGQAGRQAGRQGQQERGNAGTTVHGAAVKATETASRCIREPSYLWLWRTGDLDLSDRTGMSVCFTLTLFYVPVQAKTKCVW